MHKQQPTDKLLARIKESFYCCNLSDKRFYEDRRMLLYALTWPAKWMDQRGLQVGAQQYERLITERLKSIAQYGRPERYQRYFPGYLLKCLQDWFAYHGDELYEELKHVRNQLYRIEALLNSQHTAEVAEDIVTPMAKAHAILMSQCRHKRRTDTRQLKLF